MYLLNTLLDEYRLPYMEKQQICEESVSIKNTEKLYEILNQYFKLGKRSEEYVYMAALDSRLNVIGFFEISHGTVNGSYFNNREIFMKALIAGAASIVLAHNHPSGDPTPSKEDLLTTRRIREAGALIGIELLDHIIIGDNCYFSLREKGFFSQESANR